MLEIGGVSIHPYSVLQFMNRAVADVT